MKTVETGVLALSYLEDGPPGGWPVLLSHGFPFDVHAYDEVVPLLTVRGARVIRPWLRGFGPTRFLSAVGTADQAGMFTARHEHRVIDAGHNLPPEAPAAFADAVLTVRRWLDAGERG